MASTSATLRDLGKHELSFTVHLARSLRLRLMVAAALLRVAGWLMGAETVVEVRQSLR
jgi:hypothetical protein